jgi:hypothetical protein
VNATNISINPPDDFIDEMFCVWENLASVRETDPAWPPFGAWVCLMWRRTHGNTVSQMIRAENLRPARVNPQIQALTNIRQEAAG